MLGIVIFMNVVHKGDIVVIHGGGYHNYVMFSDQQVY